MTRPAIALALSLAAGPALAAQPAPQPTPPGATPAPSAAPAAPAAPPARVVPLEEALRIGLSRQPQLQQARASADAAKARVDQAFAPMLPQISGTAFYERYSTSTGSSVSGGAFSLGRSSGAQDLWSAGLTGRQLLYDFGQTPDRWLAARASHRGLEETERVTIETVALGIRTAYFNAVAAKALVGVAQETLDNESKHLEQVRGQVDVGTRPQIDYVSEQANYANARVKLLQAQNTYATSQVLVEQAMGVTDLGRWDVAQESLPPIQGEGAAPELLLAEALKARPDLSSLERQLDAQRLTTAALRGGYGPSLSLAGAYSQAGPARNELSESWNAQLLLTWPLFQGGLTRGQVLESSANELQLAAQLEQARQQVRVDVEQARLGVVGAIATLDAAKDASLAARERLTLAEGRYEAGVGNIIELSDAQLQLTTALGQQVQSEFQLAVARSQLLRALGRD